MCVYGYAYKVSELSEVLFDLGNNSLERSTLEYYFRDLNQNSKLEKKYSIA